MDSYNMNHWSARKLPATIEGNGSNSDDPELAVLAGLHWYPGPARTPGSSGGEAPDARDGHRRSPRLSSMLTQRTSPIAKIPGMLVSNSWAGRVRDDYGGPQLWGDGLFFWTSECPADQRLADADWLDPHHRLDGEVVTRWSLKISGWW